MYDVRMTKIKEHINIVTHFLTSLDNIDKNYKLFLFFVIISILRITDSFEKLRLGIFV